MLSHLKSSWNLTAHLNRQPLHLEKSLHELWLKDVEFNENDPNDLQDLMDVLPNIDVSDVMEIPKVFQCDEQTLPCDHTTKYRTMTGWCNNLDNPSYGKSVRAFTRLLAPAYDDGLMSPRSRSVTGTLLPSSRLISVNIHNDVSAPHVRLENYCWRLLWNNYSVSGTDVLSVIIANTFILQSKKHIIEEEQNQID